MTLLSHKQSATPEHLGSKATTNPQAPCKINRDNRDNLDRGMFMKHIAVSLNPRASRWARPGPWAAVGPDPWALIPDP
jgi:hypothetical protein